MSTAREELHAALKPLLPGRGKKRWRLYPYDTALDRPDTVSVMLSQREIQPLPASPSGAVEIEFIVTIVSPQDRGEQAEDELDDGVLALTIALRKAGIRWSSAKKRIFGSQNLMSYDITVTVTASPDPEE